MKTYQIEMKIWNFPIDDNYILIVEANGPKEACKKAHKFLKERFDKISHSTTVIEL